MQFQGEVRRRGRVRVTPWRRDPGTGVWCPGVPEVFDNLVTEAGLDLQAKAVGNTATKTQILYLALGSDATLVTAGMTTLGSEEFRKQVTDYTTGIATGQVTVTTYVAPGEANDFHIQEIGWYAGNADATADSGTLVAAVNYDRQKTNTEALQIDRVETFS